MSVLRSGTAALTPQLTELPHRELYKLLKAYYDNNALYEVLAELSYDNSVWQPGRKPLRNPAYRAVEFYVDTVWPGTLPEALPIQVADKAAPKSLKDAIEQVWAWSNWGAQKQVAMRKLANLGDMFLKVVRKDDAAKQPQSVYFQLLDPASVSDFDTDERNFLTFIRLDIPQTRRKTDGKLEGYIHTEVWDKASQTYRVWEHKRGLDEALEKLGPPLTDRVMTGFGIDFLPFVHAKFRDVGERRGVACFTQSLDKIDEANAQATRLYQMLYRYNKADWALRANGMDASGRPLPPPKLEGLNNASDRSDPNILTIGDERFFRLPGTSELQSLVPAINYEAALSILQDHMTELEKDMPELVYYKLPDQGELSGRAVRLMLSAGVQRALEVRGNAEGALVRANQMALTIGAKAGLFKNIGTFENGDFEHSFAKRDIIPVSADEHAEAVGKKYVAVKQAYDADVPVEWVLEHDFDISEDQLKDFAKAKMAEIEKQQEDAIDQAEAAARAAAQQGQLPQNGQPPVGQQNGNVPQRTNGA